MAGFPTRTTRAAFGPTKRNASVGLVTPEYHAGATEINLDYWQTAGMSLAICRAWALVTWDGATSVSLTAAGEAWDPTAAAEPTVARSSAGVYTVTYAATYVDETDTAVSTSLLAASATPQGSPARSPSSPIGSWPIGTVCVLGAAGFPADASFLMMAF